MPVGREQRDTLIGMIENSKMGLEFIEEAVPRLVKLGIKHKAAVKIAFALLGDDVAESEIENNPPSQPQNGESSLRSVK